MYWVRTSEGNRTRSQPLCNPREIDILHEFHKADSGFRCEPTRFNLAINSFLSCTTSDFFGNSLVLANRFERCTLAIEPVVDPDLIEWDYGAYEGKTTDEILFSATKLFCDCSENRSANPAPDLPRYDP